MTWEELIAKAEEHANKAGIPVEQLHKPKVRETALVSFISKSSRATAKFHLDAVTGELISTQFSGPEFAPKGTGKQFSKNAQRVLALANEESRRVGCDHVGSDHLLLGLLVYGESVGAAMLSSAGLTAEAVRDRIRTIGSAAEVASNGYGRCATSFDSPCFTRRPSGIRKLNRNISSLVCWIKSTGRR